LATAEFAGVMGGGACCECAETLQIGTPLSCGWPRRSSAVDGRGHARPPHRISSRGR